MENNDILVIGEAGNGEQALLIIEELRPDVVFLDIEMPVLNGIEVANALSSTGPRVIFITAFDSYALQAFDANAIDYLVKPVEKERLDLAIGKLQVMLRNVPLTRVDFLQTAANHLNRLALKCGQHFKIFTIERISAFLAADHYCEVLCGHERILIDDSLDGIMEKLKHRPFLRIHRSAIINLEFLAEMRRLGDRKYIAILSDYFMSEIPISRDAIAAIKTKLNI